MSTDTLLVLIVALLAANLLLVGVYIVLVLKEVRTSLVRMNSILNVLEKVTSSVSAPLSNMGGALNAFAKGFEAVSSFMGKKKSRKEKE